MQQKVQYIVRELFQEVVDHLTQPEITLITGSRQVGKSVLLSQIKDHLQIKEATDESRIFSYNLDLVQDQEVLQDQTAFLQFLRDRSREGRIFVFVDEAQKVPEAPRFFKGIYDSQVNAKFILTGSSSLEAKARFKETLAGRKRVFVLAPFTFHEFVKSKDSVLADILVRKEPANAIDSASLCRLYKEYMRFGGYPRVVLAEGWQEKEALLREIYSSYVEKDAVGFWRIQHPPAFTRLVKLLAAQIGQLVNINELAQYLSIDRQTVERYLFLLEETFIIRKLSSFYRNPRQEIIKAGKIYFLDSGIRNIALEETATIDERVDPGPLFENSVFIELERIRRIQGGTVHFWRTKQKAEVDFVIERGRTIRPVEVKYNDPDGNIPRGLQSFVREFQPTHAFITTLAAHKTSVRDFAGVRVHHAYPFEIERILTTTEKN